MGEKFSLAASRTNIAMRNRQEKEATALANKQEKEKANQQKQADKAAIDASRLNISMKARQQAQATSFQGRMSSLAMPMFNPSSPWANFVAGRQVHSAMSSSYGKDFLAGRQGGMMGQAGGMLGKLSGGSALAATGIAVAAAAGVGLALVALKKIIHFVIDGLKAAFAKAKELYSKSLTSGLGVGFTTKRSTLASIIGVSEEEVLKFGAAVAFLNPKIQYATSLIAANATTLAATSMNWDAMKTNISAVFSEMAAQIAPAINRLTEFVSAMAQLYTMAGGADVVGFAIGAIIDAFTRFAAMIELPIAAIYTFIIAIEDLFTYLTNKIKHPFTKQEGAFDKTKDALGNLGKVAKAAFLPTGMGYKEKAPEGQTFMKKLPTSSWEKMGLVIGGAKNTTNELIREGNKHLSVIAASVSGQSGSPRGSFGINPTVANP
tara:strand:+ start:1 stop:1302 length:1302 start_codon:yes stop_codon:yes gene_type:complete